MTRFLSLVGIHYSTTAAIRYVLLCVSIRMFLGRTFDLRNCFRYCHNIISRSYNTNRECFLRSSLTSLGYRVSAVAAWPCCSQLCISQLGSHQCTAVSLWFNNRKLQCRICRPSCTSSPLPAYKPWSLVITLE